MCCTSVIRATIVSSANEGAPDHAFNCGNNRSVLSRSAEKLNLRLAEPQEIRRYR